MAMGQNQNRTPVNIPIPTKIGSKMGGQFTYQPKWDPKMVLTTTATSVKSKGFLSTSMGFWREADQ